MSERSQIITTKLRTSGNPWFNNDNGIKTEDKLFLLSVEEVVMYFGNSGQLKNPSDKFYINDAFNDARMAKDTNGMPSRWALRTPGSQPNMVATVANNGKIAMSGDFVNRASTALFNVGIRPAMWVRQ